MSAYVRNADAGILAVTSWFAVFASRRRVLIVVRCGIASAGLIDPFAMARLTGESSNLLLDALEKLEAELAEDAQLLSLSQSRSRNAQWEDAGRM
ncbi:protein of unknown function [Hyphomicrobium sp. MC1]|nr:protein of unknown function [Hyphomicrobium sp. MC1]